MTPTFNKNAAHGTISPPYDGAGLVQGVHYFAANGEYLFSQKEGGDRWTEGGKKAGASAPASSSVPATQNGELDLAAWARGEVKAPFFTVKKIVAKTHSDIDVTNTATIKAGLVSAGVVSAEEAGL